MVSCTVCHIFLHFYFTSDKRLCFSEIVRFILISRGDGRDVSTGIINLAGLFFLGFVSGAHE